MQNVSPRYHAALTSEMQQMIDEPSALLQLLDNVAAPVSISLPQQAVQNIDSFTSLLETEKVQYRLFAAHKATYSKALIGAAAGVCGIDVATTKELRSAFECGFDASTIIATGPKSTAFLKELVKAEVTIIVDSPEELSRLIAATEAPADVLLRVSRSVINDPTIAKRSRFGMDVAGVSLACELIRNHPRIELRGIAFHLDTQSIYEKATAVQRAAQLLLELQTEFPSATVLDIGGGYGADYGLSYDQAQLFEDRLKHALRDSDETHTWQRYAYGLRLKDGAMNTEMRGIELTATTSGARRLEAVLHSPVEDYDSVSDLLRENLVELWIEPGSSLFHSAGMVAATVIESRQLDGEWLVLVDIHRNQIYFEGNEVISDPLHIPQNQPAVVSPISCTIIGHLCAENDIMSYRKITFDTIPQNGDAIVWSHTGAYRSHFSASNPIGHPSLNHVTFSPQQHLYTLENDT